MTPFPHAEMSLGPGMRSARHRKSEGCLVSEPSGDRATQKLLEKHEDIFGKQNDAVNNYLKPSQRLHIALEQVLGIGDRAELERLLQCPFSKPSQRLRSALSRVMDIGEPGSWEVLFKELRAARWEAAALAKTIKLVQSLLGGGGGVNAPQADAYSHQSPEPDSEPASPRALPRSEVQANWPASRTSLSDSREQHTEPINKTSGCSKPSRVLRRPISMPSFPKPYVSRGDRDVEGSSQASPGSIDSNNSGAEWEDSAAGHVTSRSPHFGCDEDEEQDADSSPSSMGMETQPAKQSVVQELLDRLSPEGQEAFHELRNTLDNYLTTVDVSDTEALRNAKDKLGNIVADARSFGIPETYISEAVSWQQRLVRACVMNALDCVRQADMGNMSTLIAAKSKLTDVINDARGEGLTEADLVEAETWRRRLHNVMEDLKGSIRVFCRVRPLNKKEIDEHDFPAVRSLDSMTLETSRPSSRFNSPPCRHRALSDFDIDLPGNASDGDGRDMDVTHFKFDGVFTPATQEAVFEDCRCLMQSAFDGYNVTIIAYGQTGSGKTFTITGRADQPGLAPQMITEIYRIIGQDNDRFDHRVTASMVELYKNDLVDLLQVSQGTSAQRKMSLRADKEGTAQFHNVWEEECPDAAFLAKVMARGTLFRTTGATAMNACSSRSHLIQTVKIHRVNRGTGGELTGKIVLVDLAGSERLKKSLVTGHMQKEAIEINKSLSALGDVLEALTQGHQTVPYRNHKLTQILQDSLGRTAKTLMFVHCAPTRSNIDETLASLKYATRAKKITHRSGTLSSRTPRRPSLPPALCRAQSKPAT